jgi:hypothetical protein
VLCEGARVIARREPACRCYSILEGLSTFWGRGSALGGRRKEQRSGARGARTSPYSFVSQMSRSGRRLPSCSLQRTTGCIVPDAPLKKTDELGSRFAALVFRGRLTVCVSRVAMFKRTRGSLLESQSRTCNRETRHTRYGTLPDNRYTV